MKRLNNFFGMTLVLLMTVGHAQASIIYFDATLSGDQEVAPVSSSASGIATMMFDNVAMTLDYQITLSGLDLDTNQTPSTADDVLAMHFHNAPFGANGGVAFSIFGDNDLLTDPILGIVSGTWDASEALASSVTALLAGNLYINVHTTAVPSGEIRGQVMMMQSVPEPSVLLLFGLGAAGLVFRRKL